MPSTSAIGYLKTKVNYDILSYLPDSLETVYGQDIMVEDFGKEGSNWNYVFADIVLTVIPVVVVYSIGQRYIIGGVTAGAVKG